MNSDRFTYEKGDIQFKRSQCDFCKHNCKDKVGNNMQVCIKYPEGKPAEVLKTLVQCSYIEF